MSNLKKRTESPHLLNYELKEEKRDRKLKRIKIGKVY